MLIDMPHVMHAPEEITSQAMVQFIFKIILFLAIAEGPKYKGAPPSIARICRAELAAAAFFKVPAIHVWATPFCDNARIA